EFYDLNGFEFINIPTLVHQWDGPEGEKHFLVFRKNVGSPSPLAEGGPKAPIFPWGIPGVQPRGEKMAQAVMDIKTHPRRKAEFFQIGVVVLEKSSGRVVLPIEVLPVYHFVMSIICKAEPHGELVHGLPHHGIAHP